MNNVSKRFKGQERESRAFLLPFLVFQSGMQTQRRNSSKDSGKHSRSLEIIRKELQEHSLGLGVVLESRAQR